MAQYHPPVWMPAAVASIFTGTVTLGITNIIFPRYIHGSGSTIGHGAVPVIVFYIAALICMWRSHRASEKFTTGDIMNPIDLAGYCVESVITSLTLLIGYITLTRREIVPELVWGLVGMTLLYLIAYIIWHHGRIVITYRRVLVD